MTVGEFCLRKTQAEELCAITEDGWIIATAWIDHEDLFVIHPDIIKKKVKGDKWGTLRVVTEHGDYLEVPCHYINC